MHGISRRTLLKAAGAGATGMIGFPRLSTADDEGRTAAAERPNVLFILTDQQRWDSLSCNGNAVVQTPNLDRLAAEGANFTQAVCLSPLCGPSRAGLLTGLIGSGHGCHGNAELHQKAGLKPEARTFDEHLGASGYECEYQGKWHTGSAHREVYRDGLKDHYLKLYHDEMAGRFSPPADWAGLALRKDRYTNLPYRPYPVDDMMLNAPKQGFNMPHHNEAGESYIPKEHSLTAWTAQRIIRYLRSGPKRPFSATCSILHPHAPLVASPPYNRMFDPAKMPMPANVQDDLDLPKARRPIPGALPLTPDGLGGFISLYYGLVAEVDHWVGEILRALRETGLDRNTLVIFTSDHGELMGSHGTLSKGQFWEEAWRVPLLMRLPGRIKGGLKLDTPVCGVDLAPTILDYCGLGLTATGLAGTSVRPVLEGGSFARRYSFGELGRPNRAMRAVRSSESKLIMLPDGETRLYDLATDPGEQHNLLSAADRTPARVDRAKALRKELQSFLESHGDDAHRTLPAIQG